MNVRLVVQHGGKQKVFNIQGATCIVGRARGNAVRIPSPEVSRQHCRLVLDRGIVTAEDLGSVNGTYVNGRKIKGAQVVHPGDALEIGPVSFVVEYEMTGAARPKVKGGTSGDLEVLEALADGDIMDAADVPMLEALDDPLGLHGIDDDIPELEAVRPPTDPAQPIAADFEFESPWQMPDGGDLRDILAQMEEDDQPPTKPHKPKKR